MVQQQVQKKTQERKAEEETEVKGRTEEQKELIDKSDELEAEIDELVEQEINDRKAYEQSMLEALKEDIAEQELTHITIVRLPCGCGGWG